MTGSSVMSVVASERRIEFVGREEVENGDLVSARLQSHEAVAVAVRREQVGDEEGEAGAAGGKGVIAQGGVEGVPDGRERVGEGAVQVEEECSRPQRVRGHV